MPVVALDVESPAYLDRLREYLAPLTSAVSSAWEYGTTPAPGRREGPLFEFLNSIPPAGLAVGAVRTAPRLGSLRAIEEAAGQVAGPWRAPLIRMLAQVLNRTQRAAPNLVGEGKALTLGDLQGQAMERVMKRLPELLPEGVARGEVPTEEVFQQVAKTIGGGLKGDVSKALRRQIQEVAQPLPLTETEEILRRLSTRAADRFYARTGKTPHALDVHAEISQLPWVQKHGLPKRLGEITPERIEELRGRVSEHKSRVGASALAQELMKIAKINLTPEAVKGTYEPLEQAVRALPGKQRSVIELLYPSKGAPLTLREAGERLGIANTGVLKHSRRALAALGEELNKFLKTTARDREIREVFEDAVGKEVPLRVRDEYFLEPTRFGGVRVVRR